MGPCLDENYQNPFLKIGPETPFSIYLYRSESLTQLSNARDQVKKKPSEASSKDYNKHWLIQEAEQRRISEAKQKQNPGAGAGLNVEKIENINNNNGHEYHNYPDKRVQNNVSDNIYANVDTSNITFSKR